MTSVSRVGIQILKVDSFEEEGCYCPIFGLQAPHKHRGHNSSTGDFSDPEEVLLNPENGHLSLQDVTTAVDGSFQAKFKVQWEDLCLHPRALHIAFEEEMQDHDLLVDAQFVPSSRIHKLNTILHLRSIPLISLPLTALIRTSITHSSIRVISDIDDTVKCTGVWNSRVVYEEVQSRRPFSLCGRHTFLCLQKPY